MNDNDLNYFSDFKHFLNYILKNNILFIIIIFLSMIIGYSMHQLDSKKINLNSKTSIVLNKEISNNYNIYYQNYLLNSQTQLITEYFDLDDLIFNITMDQFVLFFESKNINYQITDNQQNNINITLNNYKPTASEIDNIKLKIKSDFNVYVEEFMNLEYIKLHQSLSLFLLDFYVQKDINSYYEINNDIPLNYEDFRKLYNDGRTKIPYRFITNDFLIGIGVYFFNLCHERILFKKNDNFCKINNHFKKYKLNDNLKNVCELMSPVYNYQKIILTLLENKITCSGGFNISKQMLFEPLKVFLKNIDYPINLYTYELIELENKNISLVMYLLYSIVFGFFIFILFSLFYAIYKSR
tara:strand:+ start:2677 stop:3738 length:1062 start_codon:yes stop_codon:yes gene_type:complete